MPPRLAALHHGGSASSPGPARWRGEPWARRSTHGDRRDDAARVDASLAVTLGGSASPEGSGSDGVAALALGAAAETTMGRSGAAWSIRTASSPAAGPAPAAAPGPACRAVVWSAGARVQPMETAGLVVGGPLADGRALLLFGLLGPSRSFPWPARARPAALPLCLGLARRLVVGSRVVHRLVVDGSAGPCARARPLRCRCDRRCSAPPPRRGRGHDVLHGGGAGGGAAGCAEAGSCAPWGAAAATWAGRSRFVMNQAIAAPAAVTATDAIRSGASDRRRVAIAASAITSARRAASIASSSIACDCWDGRSCPHGPAGRIGQPGAGSRSTMRRRLPGDLPSHAEPGHAERSGSLRRRRRAAQDSDAYERCTCRGSGAYPDEAASAAVGDVGASSRTTARARAVSAHTMSMTSSRTRRRGAAPLERLGGRRASGMRIAPRCAGGSGCWNASRPSRSPRGWWPAGAGRGRARRRARICRSIGQRLSDPWPARQHDAIQLGRQLGLRADGAAASCSATDR